MSDTELHPHETALDEDRIQNLLSGAVEPIEETISYLKSDIENLKINVQKYNQRELSAELSDYEPTNRFRFAPAGQTLGHDQPCYIKPSDGKMYRYNAKLPIEWYCGLATKAYTKGQDAVAIIEGIFTLNQKFTTGKNVYVRTNGKLSQKQTTYNIVVGTMKTNRDIVLQIPTGDTGDDIALLDTNKSNLLNLDWNENDTADRTLSLLVKGADRSLTMEANAIISQDYSTDSRTVQFAELLLAQTRDDNAFVVQGYDDKSGSNIKAYIDSSGDAWFESNGKMYFYTSNTDEAYSQYIFKTLGDDQGGNANDLYITLYGRDDNSGIHLAARNEVNNSGAGRISWWTESVSNGGRRMEIHAVNGAPLILLTNAGETYANRKKRYELDSYHDFYASDETALFRLLLDTHPTIRCMGSDANFQLQSDTAEFDFQDDDDVTYWSLNKYVMTLHGAGSLAIPDEQATAFAIKEGTNTYMSFCTTTGVEKIGIAVNLDLDGDFDHSGTNLGVFGTAPTTQQAHIVDADGTLADITTKFNTLLADLEGYGFLASS